MHDRTGTPRQYLLTLAILAFAVLATPALRASADGPELLLAALVSETDADKRVDILADLGAFQGDAVRVALETLAQDETAPPSIRMQAVCSLAGSATHDTVPLLIAITETDLTERHGYWACAIPLLGMLGDRRAEPLLKCIGDLDAEDLIGMDHMAIAALADMATHADVPYLLRKAHVWAVREPIIAALARLAAPEAIDLFISALSDEEEPETRRMAESGLIAIGPEAIPALEEALAFGAEDAAAENIRAVLETIEGAAKEN